MLLNWFAQSGMVSKAVIADDIRYINDDQRIEKEVGLVRTHFVGSGKKADCEESTYAAYQSMVGACPGEQGECHQR